jgi:lipopolysaccharide/colanic/teichoic acid biosynthesis glycosyltransferase
MIKKSNNETFLVICEILLLLLFTFSISCIFYPLFQIGTINLIIIIWALLVIFGYLFGEFEPTVSIYFGLNLRTQAIFLSTVIIYTALQIILNSLPQLNVWLLLILWLYLNILTPFVGLIIRRIFPVPVLLVSNVGNNNRLLQWWGYKISEHITRDELNNWLKLNSNDAGRVTNFDLIVVDTTNPNITSSLSQVSDGFFVNFIGLKSYNMLDYLIGCHSQVITKYPGRGTSYRIKRIIDFFVCLSALILSAPLFLFLLLCIKIDSPGSVFYRHRRLGKNMKPFDLLKFRTMYNDADKRLKIILATNPKLKVEFEQNFKLKNDPRITRTGKIIRQFSLDEMPQILNVLNGDMSLVGPRPIVLAEIPYYEQYSLDIFRVLPGMAGLWQTSGRSETTYQDRVKLDTQYVQTWSLLNDIKLLIKTIPAVASQRGAY